MAAFEIHGSGRGRATLSDQDDFLDRQLKVVLDPLFKEWIESQPAP